MMVHHRNSFGRNRGGVAATELAILLPFLALIFVGVVDFCRIFYVTQTVQQAAYTGALYASKTVSHNPTLGAVPKEVAQEVPPFTETKTAEVEAIQAAIAEAASLDPPLNASDISIATDNGMTTVTVRYRFRTLTGHLGGSPEVEIVRSAVMSVPPSR
jgi:Flp pilus assembly protein TadG